MKLRTLYDINVLLALADATHGHNELAQSHYAENRSYGWASCALTQNGFVRIISQSSYERPVSLQLAFQLLDRMTADPFHAFWPEDISIGDASIFDHEAFLHPRQITDIYLLALAVKNNGRLVTLDQRIPLRAVRGATPDHLVCLFPGSGA